MIQEKDIVRCEKGQVTYRWRDSKTGKSAQRTVSGVEFLRLVLQHVLPKGFRRAPNYGFLHPNSKRLIALLRLLVFKLCSKAPADSAPATKTERPKLLCRCCGAVMAIVRRRILPLNAPPVQCKRDGLNHRHRQAWVTQGPSRAMWRQKIFSEEVGLGQARPTIGSDRGFARSNLTR